MNRMLLLLCLLPVLAVAADIEGQVIAIADGDTLTVLHGREQVKVRLTDIDAPEKAQPFGQRARQSLAELCFHEQARVEDRGRDRYGRTLGRVWCAGVDANAEQVRRGMAWVYDRYVTDRTLYAAQDKARAEQRGLWSEGTPTPPWEWRHHAHK
ncbi:thermonuclease family protein [Iodobacter sp. BJB302]|uniref:thermonuclease family protein n=1 Tax=Iodobacter sp. BJB302 TaxID=1506510 RepID=UPI000C0F3DAF|nr:thermonuclease family protein [Iodobacter sp. BJB302]PHV00766.1 nuclease [Iodobacter sp. BJB302]